MITINGKECWPSRGVATLLNIGRNSMLQELRSMGMLNKDNSPTLSYRSRGLFVIKQERFGPVTYFTSAGIDMARELLKDVPRKVSKPVKAKDLPIELIEIING
jgi:phage antirepressor YoqD-like protein